MTVKMIKNKQYSKKELEKIFKRDLFDYQVTFINYIISNPTIQIKKVKYKLKSDNISKSRNYFTIDELHSYRDIKLEGAIKRWIK